MKKLIAILTGICCVAIIVAADPPTGAPTLLSPANGSKVTQNPVNFDWTDVTDADYYNIQIATDTNFTGILFNSNVGPSQYSQTISNGIRYWRVRGANGTSPDSGPWSNTFWFDKKGN